LKHARSSRILGYLGGRAQVIWVLATVLALSNGGCSGTTADVLDTKNEAAVYPPIFFATGRVGTTEVTIHAADAAGSTWTLAEFDVRAPGGVITGTESDLEYLPWEALSPSPDGTALVFRDRDSATLIEVKSGETSALPPYARITWSSDSSKIAYNDPDGVKVFDRDTSRTSLVIPGHRCVEDVHFSPDGTQLAYLSSGCIAAVGEPAEVRIVRADGRGDHLVHREARFCRNYGDTTSAVWSPDGAYVAFFEPPAASGDGFDFELSGSIVFRIARADGADSGLSVEWPAAAYRAVVAPDRGSALYAVVSAAICDWSPRANRLAVSGPELHVVDADRGSKRALDATVAPDGTPDDFWVSVTWAPDGRHLTRISHDGERHVLRTMDVSGNERLRDVALDDDTARFTEVRWAADGKHLLRRTGWAETSTLTLSNVESDEEELIATRSANFGFNKGGTRLVYTWPTDLPPSIRNVPGGPALEQPEGTVGWISDDAVVVVTEDTVVVRTVDGASESPVWTNTDDERLLNVPQLRLFSDG
jgi:hypothetical protein